MKNANECSVFSGEPDVIDSLLDSKSKYRKIVQAAISRWVKDFQDGVIQVQTVDDLRTLIQIDLELQKGVRSESRMQQKKKTGGG